MQTFLIRLGKAVKILQQEGLFSGGRRIISLLAVLFRKVKPGDILFITSGVGDSARYRTANVAEELEMQGFKCSIAIQDNPFLTSYADKFQIFIFHRVLFTAKVRKLIEKIKTQGKEIIFETDDLIFDSRYFKEMDYQKEINSWERKMYENDGVGAEILKDPYIKVCTTTAIYLADKLREYGKKVFIVPNKLSKNDIKIAEKINHSKFNPPAGGQNSIKLGYFSG